MTIGERIKNARKAADLSQEELGRRLKIGKSSVSEWESGKRPLPLDVVMQIAEILHVTVPYLMGWQLDANTQSYIPASVSPAALDIARHYDSLSEQSKSAATLLILFESADTEIKNKVISLLVDHANEKLSSRSSFSGSVAAAPEFIAAEAPTDQPKN